MIKYSGKTVCFTDIIDSTVKTREIGSEHFSPYRTQHSELAKALCKRFSGDFSKGLGDGALIPFDDPKNALCFACNMQFYYEDFPSKISTGIQLRIGVHSGLIELEDSDVQGDSVNFASRVQGKGDAATVLISDAVLENLKTIYGEMDFKIFSSQDIMTKLKGYNGEMNLHIFNVKEFFKREYELSFYALAYDHLENMGINFSSMQKNDLLSPGVLVWPVVPRRHINLLHHGFLEIMRIFALLGWEIKILLADYGKDGLDSSITDNFEGRLLKALEKRFIKPTSVERLSRLISINNKNACCALTYEYLYPSLEEINVSTMKEIIEKKYEKNTAVDPNKSTLNAMGPIFTLAGVRQILCASAKAGKKNIVLSGIDESKMWEECIILEEKAGRKLAAVQIGLLKFGEYQYNQNKKEPYWPSVATLLEDMGAKGSNIQQWASCQLFAMQRFPFVDVGEHGASSGEDDDAKIIARKIIECLSSTESEI